MKQTNISVFHSRHRNKKEMLQCAHEFMDFVTS